MMAQGALHQSVLQRHLQALTNRNLNQSNTGKLVVQSKPRKRSISQAHHGNDKDLDTFKGRLPGVEDGLIDAIISDSSPDRPTGHHIRKASTSCTWYSQEKADFRKSRLRGSKEGLDVTLALPAERYADTSSAQDASGALEHHSPRAHPFFEGRKRCSIVDKDTAAHHIWCTCAVASYRDSIGSDDSDSDDTCTKRAWRSIEVDHLASVHSVPTTPSSGIASPSTSEPEVLEALDIQEYVNDIVVDPVILERSSDDPSLGMWDLTNWRTLEFTMHDLLVVKE